MLPRPNRLTSGPGFGRAVRVGSRAGSRTLVVHLADADPSATVGPVSVGFIVDRRVGGAVVRNRVRRRLRHLVRARLDRLSPGSVFVVRALPGAATASGPGLEADLDHALGRVLAPRGQTQRRRASGVRAVPA